jgi:hypothetical protein
MRLTVGLSQALTEPGEVVVKARGEGGQQTREVEARQQDCLGVSG